MDNDCSSYEMQWMEEGLINKWKKGELMINYVIILYYANVMEKGHYHNREKEVVQYIIIIL